VKKRALTDQASDDFVCGLTVHGGILEILIESNGLFRKERQEAGSWFSPGKNARPKRGGRTSVNFEFGLVAIEQRGQGLLRALPHLLPDGLARRAMWPGAPGQARHQ
jgi:hypothetical protein